MILLLQVISLGLAGASAGLWLKSAKIPLPLVYDFNEPYVLEQKVLWARAEQIANDAAIKTAFDGQAHWSFWAALCALGSALAILASMILAVLP